MAPLARMARERPLDLVIAVFFSFFALVSVSIDALTALDVDLARSSWPTARAYGWFARHVDPLLLRPSVYVRTTSAVSAFVFGPFYCVAVYAIARGRAWIRLPAVAWAAVMLYSLVVWTSVELFGDTPPLDLGLFALAYAPYVVVPMLVLWRMRAPDPFGGRA
jgi:hypothetical protein